MLKEQAKQLIQVIVLMMITGTVLAQNKVVVIPLGGDDVVAPSASKVVFFTDTTYAGNLGGILGADDKCQQEAQDQGLDGRFKAWIHTDLPELSPDRVSFAKSKTPYVNTSGEPLWPSYPVEGTLSDVRTSEILSVTGAPQVSAVTFWTGIAEFVGDPPVRHCSRWTTSERGITNDTLGTLGGPDEDVGICGDFPQNPLCWRHVAARGCEVPASLICFQQ